MLKPKNLRIADEIMDCYELMSKEEQILVSHELNKIEQWLYKSINMILIEEHTKDEVAASAFALYKHIQHRNSHPSLQSNLTLTKRDLEEHYASLLRMIFKD